MHGCSHRHRSDTTPRRHDARCHRARRRHAAVVGVWVVVLVLAAGCATNRSTLLADATRTLRPVALETFEGVYWDGYLSPGRDKLGSGLFLLEPYRPGAIPVVLIHGLVSDPSTWVETHRALRSDPTIASRYQFWAFRYETGPTYLDAAADLRDELHRVRSALDPGGQDVALSRVVLVGHSMGGLVSKLQITHSDDRLWRTISNHSPDELRADAITKSQLTRAFFFNPQPGIGRVVYIATPHLGSPIAVSRLGTLGRRLVGFPEAMLRGYSSFLRDNANLFLNLPERPPTSVDHLKPHSGILRATTELRTSPAVIQHAIYGVGERTSNWWTRDGDGYVTVRSATGVSTVTQVSVQAEHSDVHRHPSAVAELRRVLHEHALLSRPF